MCKHHHNMRHLHWKQSPTIESATELTKWREDEHIKHGAKLKPAIPSLSLIVRLINTGKAQ